MNKVIIICLLLLSYSVFTFSSKQSSYQRPNVLLITVDTLRADHLGVYGYHRNTSPTIDQFAKDGILFSNAIVQTPETLPSIVSIMTSRYPLTHGVRMNTYKYLEDEKTLAEVLKENGYSTAAFVSSCILSKSRGIGRGFDLYDETSPDDFLLLKSCQRTAEKTTKSANSWLEKQSDKEFFLWIHYIDPHSLYNPPPPYDTKFLKNQYDGKITGDVNQFFDITENKIKVDEKDVKYLTGLYDGEIAFMDSQFALLIEKLKQIGLENTLVIFTSDHGESLGEHNYFFEHGDLLYDDQTKVPLIISHPNLPKDITVKKQVQSVDIMPTILDFLKLKTEYGLTGKSLLPLVYNKDNTNYEEIAFSESIDCWRYSIRSCFPLGVEGKIYSLRTGKWKYILDQLDQRNSNNELYNLIDDPLEQRNLATVEKKLAHKFNVRIRKIIQENNNFRVQGYSEDLKEELEALGYIQ